MIANLLKLDLTDMKAPSYSDMKGDGKWYNSSINAVSERELMGGYPDGSFRANAKITRAELTSTIENLTEKVDAQSTFPDIYGHWAENTINRVYGNGHIGGYPDGTFKPNQYITRAETAKVLNSLFKRQVDAEGLEKITKGELRHFSDLDKNHWAYYELVESANGHKYSRRFSDKVIENWHEVL